MTDPDFILLYVESPAASATFYADLLGKPPVDSSPNFVMFVLGSSVKLGLWARHDVAPAATVGAGGGELAFTLPDAATVESTHLDLKRRGLRIVQAPVSLDFGHTFVALDPDGHRLRFFAPAAR